MSHVAVVSPSRASGELAEAYRQLGALTGSVPAPNVMRIFSLRPASLRRAARGWELAMWVGTEPRDRREMAGALVSRANDCHY